MARSISSLHNLGHRKTSTRVRKRQFCTGIITWWDDFCSCGTTVRKAVSKDERWKEWKTQQNPTSVRSQKEVWWVMMGPPRLALLLHVVRRYHACMSRCSRIFLSSNRTTRPMLACTIERGEAENWSEAMGCLSTSSLKRFGKSAL